MTIHMIWAEARNRVIGAGNTIPWRVPGEQRIFKERTMGAAVVMGRATWDSLPRKPLPGRENIVLTRNPAWTAAGATVIHSLDDVKPDDFWVMGGAEVYAEFLPRAGHIVRTRIDIEVAGDAFAPELGDEWVVTESAVVEAPTGVSYVVEDLRRRDPA
ncbi:dihydrofolate reductase [Actinoplanes utahensis]|uniref:Dihydrofolate reductase n=1 Tax=Actinoplanes utahensis TaxID=1869 RepID=A0A0A6X6Y9_ACTUT|nr:dihydrofolate reductase [Actinoplanes utahensis]KHD75882.1 dihydrofolate reductase [Actinoplanes utahensis]GIF34966.1 dihydrofolate reductase [Actinoplanes utahensis]